MKSIHWGNPGNFKMNGKKSMKYTDDIIQNFKESERIKEITQEIRKIIAKKD